MSGNAINQVLLNLPQGGKSSARNTGATDANTPDFAQTFQDARKTQTKARDNSAANLDQLARNQTVSRQKVADKNAATERNLEKSRSADKLQQKSERVHSTSDHKPINRSETAKPKKADVPSAADTDQACVPADATQQAYDDPIEAGAANTNQNQAAGSVNKADCSPVDGDAVEVVGNEAKEEPNELALLDPLLSIQGNNLLPVNEPVEQADGVEPTLVKLTAETVLKDAPSIDGEAQTKSTTKINDVIDGDTTALETAGQDNQTLTNVTLGALAGSVQNQRDNNAETVAPLGTLASSLASSSLKASVGGVSTTVSPNSTTSEVVTGITDLADDFLSQASTLFKGDGQSAGSSSNTPAQEASADTEGDLLNGGSDKSILDKSTFEKLIKTVAQSALGEASPREQITSASPNSSTSSALNSLARPQEAQGTSALRNFVVQTSVPAQVGQPQWSQGVGEKVLWLAAQNISSAEINLNPLDLGPMQVKVSVHQDQATVTFTSHHPVVREVLDQNLNRLRDMFSEQGLNLVNVDVSDRSFQRQQGEGKEQQGQGGAKSQEAEEETLTAVSIIKPQRLVDHYA